VCAVSSWTGLVLDALLGNMIELGPSFRVTAVFHGTMQVPASAVWTQYPSGHVDLVRAPLARLAPHAPVPRCAAWVRAIESRCRQLSATTPWSAHLHLRLLAPLPHPLPPPPSVQEDDRFSALTSDFDAAMGPLFALMVDRLCVRCSALPPPPHTHTFPVTRTVHIKRALWGRPTRNP
jgi:hypothetical protein